MTREEFRIGESFWCGDRHWRCTDIGNRTVVAMRIDQVQVESTDPTLCRVLTHDAAAAEGWFNGPPYAVAEVVFDESDIEGCTPNAANVPA